MELTAARCASLLSGGGLERIPTRATAYVSDSMWQELVRKHRGKGCERLAELARNILDGRDLLTELTARTVGASFGLLGRPRIERVFATEVMRRVPLPDQLSLGVAARGLQAAGIYICYDSDRPLSTCACLRDVLKNETREHVEQLVEGALADWQELPDRMRDALA